MAHRDAKIVVPIGAVNTVAYFFGGFVIVEKHNVGDIGKIIIITQFFGAARHFLRADLGPNSESTIGSTVPSA